MSRKKGSQRVPGPINLRLRALGLSPLPGPPQPSAPQDGPAARTSLARDRCVLRRRPGPEAPRSARASRERAPAGAPRPARARPLSRLQGRRSAREGPAPARNPQTASRSAAGRAPGAGTAQALQLVPFHCLTSEGRRAGRRPSLAQRRASQIGGSYLLLNR